jgi:hypothetical protein
MCNRNAVGREAYEKERGGTAGPTAPGPRRHKRWRRLLVMLTIEAEPRKQRVARQEPGYERTALAQCWIAKTQRPQARA